MTSDAPARGPETFQGIYRTASDDQRTFMRASKHLNFPRVCQGPCFGMFVCRETNLHLWLSWGGIQTMRLGGLDSRGTQPFGRCFEFHHSSLPFDPNRFALPLGPFGLPFRLVPNGEVLPLALGPKALWFGLWCQKPSFRKWALGPL